MNNVKTITIILSSLLIGATITFAWTNKTIEQQIEEHNQAVLADCLTKARVKKTAKEILEYASNCNQDILTTISTPRPVETITGTGKVSQWEIDCLSQFKNEDEQFTCWMSGSDYLKNKLAHKLEGNPSEKYFREFKNKYGTHSTGNTVPPLGFQLIPSANASVTDVEENGKQKVTAIQLNIQQESVENVAKIRTPKQIYEQVKHLGYREAPAISLIRTCKASSGDPRHCILVGLVLMYNEAGNQQNSKACISRNNCFGINSGKKVYSSLDEGMENWVQKYNKYWYKANGASFFYSSAGKVSPSRYCTSEDSSKSSIGCPHGLSIATDKWNKLYPIIY